MRGKQVSRTYSDIITEAQGLQSQGIQEISLIAQDLTFYGREKNGPGSNLPELLKGLLSETDLPWIRMMYAYPAFINDDLMDLMANEPRICSYLDMPIQHASNNMLKKMRRGHTQESLRKLLLSLRDNVPGIALRTTLLLGFPSETNEDVDILHDLIEEIKFDRLGCFPYSDEEGTHAAEAFPVEDLIEEDVIQDRISRIMNTQAAISLDRNESLIGEEIEVLIDSEAEGSDYHFYARTQWDAPEVDNRVCILEGDATPGEFRKVKILSASEYDLEAKIID
jgi:ribosomal protein S12 methylthiotransferase